MKKRVDKCTFCNIPCDNEHCNYSKRNKVENKTSSLKVTIQEAFEAGKLTGKYEILAEFNELTIMDSNFKAYIEARLKSLHDSIN